MSEDNVRPFPLTPEVAMTAIMKGLESFKPAPPPDLELALWDDIVRVRLSSPLYAPGEPARMPSPEEAIDVANKVLAARRKFAAGR